MGSTMADLMARRAKERRDAYEAEESWGLQAAARAGGWRGRAGGAGSGGRCLGAARERAAASAPAWDGGRGSHHPDYDPSAAGEGVVKATRPTEELYLAIVSDDVARVYEKIDEGADVNFVFGPAYKCPEGYTPLMVAAHRGRLECAKALLRAGADPNYVNGAGDLTLFWGIDGGPAMIQLLVRFGANLDAASPKGWTPLSYARAKGKYGPTEEAGIYPEDVLSYYGAKSVGDGPPVLGVRSPRASFDPEAPNFGRERGSYQREFEHP